ncbi:MAG TPA: 4'-phosphopantetheinyl transferase superfamily protein [Aliidongia sp.]|uniref:4'-phosphopantetheinyl transferase family protein n=1 Tax=Aliidongia sp. TaxID=1914230 RepID=UPI002DDCA850|nr:4'-phosphopantetheinyl transferase superfamily protein [Aliidongia sp.]HEV2678757.1 4'-phosphopantetheinyl transferase superfamily protein [Aliidongia sp.]
MNARALVLWSELAPLDADPPRWSALAADLPASMTVGVGDSLRESDRRLRLLGRVLLARALVRIGAGECHGLTFDSLGRPHLPGDLDPSISHTGGLACAAVGVGCRIGVDVERRQSIEPALYDRVLAPDERRHAVGSSDPDGEFLMFWTMKEAAAKADGRGLQHDPLDLLCRIGSDAQSATVQVEAVNYRIRSLPLPAGWLGSFATDTPRDLGFTAEAYSFS